MGLLSFFKRNVESPSGDVPAADAVAQARTRARQRLIGATVLLGIGVVGFPLLFETQPRPIPVDIPIEIPRKESAPPLVLPSARAPAAAPSLPAAAVPAPLPETPVAAAPAPAAPSAPRAAPPIVTERAADQGRELATPASAPAPAARTTAAPASTPAARSTTDAQRAQALLEGRAAPAKASEPGSARLVVQVGAYTDADKLREARQKVEKLGMKTYTQVVEGEGAKRTRVRVGPFATREEADKAAARIKAAGLPVAVLTL
jgi:DedD protein